MDLNTLWFGLFGVLLIGYAILDGFDLGVGMLSLVATSDHDKRVHMNAVGPVWDGNEVWLLTAGGALFAAFPNVYATVFSGFYLAFMLLLLALMARAVAFEFRSKVENPTWRRTWDLAFGLGSLVAGLLYGVAVGNVVRGVPLSPDGEFAGSFLGLLNPFALLVGGLSLVMFVVHGALFLRLKTEGALARRAERVASWGVPVWGVLWVAVLVLTFVVAPFQGEGLLGKPLLWVAAPLAVGGWVGALLMSHRAAWGWAFLGSSTAIAGQILLIGACLYPRLLPARGALDSSLTIYNAASTPLTLKVMLVIALVGMPLVIGYTAFIYRVFRGKVVLDESSY